MYICHQLLIQWSKPYLYPHCRSYRPHSQRKKQKNKTVLRPDWHLKFWSIGTSRNKPTYKQEVVNYSWNLKTAVDVDMYGKCIFKRGVHNYILFLNNNVHPLCALNILSQNVNIYAYCYFHNIWYYRFWKFSTARRNGRGLADRPFMTRSVTHTQAPPTAFILRRQLDREFSWWRWSRKQDNTAARELV